jgi:hypothetical protein
MSTSNGEVVNSNPLDAGNDSHSVESAAADFSAMLADEGKPPRREREKPAARSPEAPAPDDAGEPEGGQSERQPRGEREPAEDDARDPILDEAPEEEAEPEEDADPDAEDQDDTEDQDEDGEEDEGDDPLDAEHEITVNGETLKVTVRDALAGYMKEADYRQGTERNAREYEQVVEFATETVEHRQRANTVLQEGLALIQALQPSDEDWKALEEKDPAEFIKAQKHWAGLLQNARDIVAAQNTLAGDSSAQNERQTVDYHRKQEAELVKKLPALKDEKRATQFRAAIMDYGRKAGYSDEELIKGAVDHRDLITLYKAARFDELQASRAAAGKKGQAKVPKNSSENRARPPGGKSPRNARRAADRNLRNSGSVQDAAHAFTEMLRS